MHKGLYIAATGMLSQWENLSVVSNNLANAKTTGYKKDDAIFKSFDEFHLHRLNDEFLKTPRGPIDKQPPVGNIEKGVGINSIATIFTQGPLHYTGNDFDLAIKGEGFFSVQAKDGQKYTRNGTFSLDSKGYLITLDGERVLGEKGAIQLTGGNFKVTEDGRIIIDTSEKQDWRSPQEMDRLKLVEFKEPQELTKMGHNLYTATTGSGTPAAATKTSVHQGFLEDANVNIVEEMVKMIELQRSYEANHRVVSSFDEMIGKAVNDLARIA